MRQLMKMATLVAVCGLLSGCWDKVELENRGFVNVIGIDSASGDDDDEGVSFEKNSAAANKRFTVSLSLPSLSALADIAADDAKSKSVKHASDETLSAAMRLIDVSSSQALYFGHTKAAVLGPGLLSDEKLLRETVDALERNREISRKLIILSSKADASAILTEPIEGEPLLGMFIANFYKDSSNTAALAFRQDLESLINQLRTTNAAIIPKIEIKDKTVKLSGAAVISGFKLAGWLDDAKTRGYLWLKNRAGGAQLTVPFEGVYVPLRVSHAKAKLAFADEGGRILCVANVNVKGAIEEYIFTANGKLSEESKLQALSEAYANVVADEILETFECFQREFKADGFALQEEIRKHYPDIYDKYAENWEAAYAGMALEARVNVDITGTGSIN